MTPIAPDVLDAAMADLRAGRTLAWVVGRLRPVSLERLRRQLRARFPDYDAVMRSHQRRYQDGAPGPKARRQTSTIGQGFRDVRFEARQAEERLGQAPRFRVRPMAEFSAEELEALRRKLSARAAPPGSAPHLPGAM